MSYECPICKIRMQERSANFPFCSRRCQLLDLGAWASGRYVIAGGPLQEEDDERKDDSNNESEG